MTIHQFPSKSLTTEPPGGGDGMDTRLTKLETRLDTLLPMLATKTDVSETKAWIAVTAFVITGLIITVLSIVINAKLTPPPSSPPAAQQAPIVIFPAQTSAPNPPTPQSPQETKHGR